MSQEFVSTPCPNRPFRRNVRPFLRPDRSEDLAYNAENPYGTFPCHVTTVPDDDSDSGEMLETEVTKQCAGHLTLKHNANGETEYDDDGFKPSAECYEDSYEMIEAYTEEWNEIRERREA